MAQGFFYFNNIKTWYEKRFSGKAWITATIKSFLDVSLDMWDGSYHLIYGADDKEIKKKKHE